MKILLLSSSPTDETTILENIVTEQIKKYKGYINTRQLSQYGNIDSIRMVCKANDVIAIFIGIEWIKQHLPSSSFLKECINALHKESIYDLPQIFICLDRNILEIPRKDLSENEQRLKTSLAMISGTRNVIICFNHHAARSTFIEFYKNMETIRYGKTKGDTIRKTSIL